jgi:hypothetical protein
MAGANRTLWVKVDTGGEAATQLYLPP